MAIKSHAESERHHYAALKNVAYQTEGLMDVLREEMMMNMPVFPFEGSDQGATLNVGTPWSGRQWDRVKQLEGMVNHLQGKVEEMIKVKQDDSY